MIRRDFPYLPEAGHGGRPIRPCEDSIGCPGLAAVGRIITGHGFHDDETGDADTGPAWFARIDIPSGDTLAGLFASALEMEPETEELRGRAFSRWSNAATLGGVAGVVYGRDSDGWEFCGAWADSVSLARAWDFLQGNPDSDRWEDFRRDHVPPPDGHGIRVELAEGFRTPSICFRVVSDSGADYLAQTDGDRVAVARDFGFRLVGPCGCDCGETTDGSVDCGECGKTAADFAAEASAYLDSVCGSGVRVADPGYFDSVG